MHAELLANVQRARKKGTGKATISFLLLSCPACEHFFPSFLSLEALRAHSGFDFAEGYIRTGTIFIGALHCEKNLIRRKGMRVKIESAQQVFIPLFGFTLNIDI